MKNTYQWKEHSVTFNCDRILAMDLLRVMEQMKYEQTWLCGKPLGINTQMLPALTRRFLEESD